MRAGRDRLTPYGIRSAAATGQTRHAPECASSIGPIPQDPVVHRASDAGRRKLEGFSQDVRRREEIYT